MAVEYFCAYHSYLQSMKRLSDAEVGRLFRAMLKYSETGELDDLPGNERFVADTIISQIDRDKQQYAKKCAINRANGALGGLANATERGANATERYRTPPKEKEKEKEKENITGVTADKPPVPSGSFEKFWSAYPKKVGKQAAKKAFDRVKVPVETLLTAIERQKCSAQWSRDNGQYIPNPATWLNQGRWEDELEMEHNEQPGDVPDGFKLVTDEKGWKKWVPID